MKASIQRLAQNAAAEAEHKVLSGHHKTLTDQYQSLLNERDQLSKEAQSLRERASINQKALGDTHSEIVSVSARLREVTTTLTDDPIAPNHAYAPPAQEAKEDLSKIGKRTDTVVGDQSGKAPDFLRDQAHRRQPSIGSGPTSGSAGSERSAPSADFLAAK